MRGFSFRHVVEMIDYPEEYDFQEFVRKSAVLESDVIYYFDGKLFYIDYEVADAVIEGCFTVVELITEAYFCRVNSFNRWILYHGNEDESEYVSKIEKIRGDTVIIPVIKSGNRFIRKVNDRINRGEFKSFL